MGMIMIESTSKGGVHELIDGKSLEVCLTQSALKCCQEVKMMLYQCTQICAWLLLGRE